jgi:hypothetical protein
MSSKTVTILAALEAGQRAMDDWARSYAPEFCDTDGAEETRRRLDETGTLYYIATVAKQLREAIGLMQQDETTTPQACAACAYTCGRPLAPNSRYCTDHAAELELIDKGGIEAWRAVKTSGSGEPA